MKLFFFRYFKKVFIYLRLHVFFNLFSGINSNLFYLSKLSSWTRKNRKVEYNDFPSKWNYEKRYPLYKWVLEKENLIDSPINYLEFGVAAGQSFRWFLSQNNNHLSCFYGFDTFTGLPEDFGVYKKGTFNNNTEPPKINDQRGKFYQGLFQQTLPGFLSVFNNEKRNVLMMDADLYSATLYVLTTIAPFLKKGDVIFFDEFAVPTHEFKAYYDFVQSYYIDMELIAAANNYYFVAFKIK
ncbi:MAG: class I SAM-dependent methyltransferase [Sphingobacteriales bacterium]|nr:class I SAM-dependent methyltransferase [Sphingobacteriales bacterium]